ncbi:MAG: hypothetical protein ACK5LK_05595 [Chthoniobacterales bacterium]
MKTNPPQTVDLHCVDQFLQSGHLKMSGNNPQGVEIGVNSRYLTRNDAGIGLDVVGGVVGTNDTEANLRRYPYVTCELGGGMMSSYTRRPIIEGDDTAALAMVKIGNGSNLPGYYMYQGGANPPGKLSTLQESKATNYPNDLPLINYDFQAPLRQYGQRGPAYDALRVLHLFLHDFGSDLAPLPPHFAGSFTDRSRRLIYSALVCSLGWRTRFSFYK